MPNIWNLEYKHENPKEDGILQIIWLNISDEMTTNEYQAWGLAEQLYAQILELDEVGK